MARVFNNAFLAVTMQRFNDESLYVSFIQSLVYLTQILSIMDFRDKRQCRLSTKDVQDAR
jgi:hypothetical protein